MPDMQRPESKISQEWLSYSEVIAEIENTGLQRGTDYSLPPSAQSFPLSVSSPYHLILGLFTRRSMQIIEDVAIKVNATDHARDTCERIVYCMRGVERNPTGKSVPFDT